MYFFLSYARSAPVGNGLPAGTDLWVRRFFDDLTGAVHDTARPGPGSDVGFIDELLRAGSDWNAILADALSAAEVFVALYSPGYFKKAWPLRERTSFQRRIQHLADGPERQRHLLPVLWSPLLSWEHSTEIEEALTIGAGVPDYADNGLRALCMLRSYHDEYRKIVERIAGHIVDVAAHHPIGPSPAPAPEEVGEVTGAPAQFVVAVLARTAADAPNGRARTVYGDEPRQWRPFAEPQALPLADYVATTAERLGLPARTATLSTQPAATHDSAAVVLVDPWVAADDAGAAVVRTALAVLPPWAVCVVVVDRRDPHFTDGVTLAGLITAMADGAITPRLIEARDLEHFLQAVPVLVTEARRRYLRLAGTDSTQPRKRGNG